ncbi:MAG: hypothetical protein R3C01_15570 [Planctomycetaceae bacterium]
MISRDCEVGGFRAGGQMSGEHGIRDDGNSLQACLIVRIGKVRVDPYFG